MGMMGGLQTKKLALFLIGFEVIFIILFAVCMDYDHSADAHYPANSRDVDKDGADHDNNVLKHYYPMFQDVHVMMFIGFGFLMMFLRRYGFSAVGLNFLLASFVIQWSMLVSAFLHGGSGHINIITLLTSDFAAATVLITFGALLGKTSPLQLIAIAFFEVVFFNINEWVGLSKLFAVDVGGSMFVHVFGAYFGLAVSRVLSKPEFSTSKKEGSNYNSDMFAMIGTVFLWMYWPSFNSALAPGDDQQRAVINTYLALAACCIISFAMSSILDPHGRFDMVHIQNATLAGGVAVGTSADMMVQPYGALLIGSVAGVLSVVGYKFITPFICSKLKVHDTCGVNNLHGMPGLLAGITGAIVTALATEKQYGYSLYQIFPMRAPVANSTELSDIQAVFSAVQPGAGRSAGVQAGFQLAALAMSLAIAIVSGIITGFIVKFGFFDGPTGSKLYDDGHLWETPADFGEEVDSSDIEMQANGKDDGAAAVTLLKEDDA